MYSSLLSVIKKSFTALVANRKGFYADVECLFVSIPFLSHSFL